MVEPKPPRHAVLVAIDQASPTRREGGTPSVAPGADLGA
jgi:hypothetical protein